MKITNITPILNVCDVPRSIEWFGHFGWKAGFTWNDGGMIMGAALRNSHGPALFAGIRCGEVEMFLCKDGQGSRGRSTRWPAAGAGQGPASSTAERPAQRDIDSGGVWMSWWYRSPAEVDEVYALAKSLGVPVTWPPTDEPWGVRECHIVHPDGHTFRISAPLNACE